MPVMAPLVVHPSESDGQHGQETESCRGRIPVRPTVFSRRCTHKMTQNVPRTAQRRRTMAQSNLSLRHSLPFVPCAGSIWRIIRRTVRSRISEIPLELRNLSQPGSLMSHSLRGMSLRARKSAQNELAMWRSAGFLPHSPVVSSALLEPTSQIMDPSGTNAGFSRPSRERCEDDEGGLRYSPLSLRHCGGSMEDNGAFLLHHATFLRHSCLLISRRLYCAGRSRSRSPAVPPIPESRCGSRRGLR